MNKPYLLIMGAGWYPEPGTGDWRGRYATQEEAESKVKKILLPKDTYTKGPRKGQIRDDEYDKYKYQFIDDKYNFEYDWYEIVNLETWEP